MKYEDLIQMASDLEKLNEKYDKGEIKDDLTPEARQDWIERCNSQH